MAGSAGSDLNKRRRLVSKKYKMIGKYSLCPREGDIRERLDTMLEYFPVVPNGALKNSEPKTCHLHLWVAKEEGETKKKPAGYKKGVVHCKNYFSHLCFLCFTLFHEVEDLKYVMTMILSSK
eukprot:1009035-Ditylum_brightwellii.AAC.1